MTNNSNHNITIGSGGIGIGTIGAALLSWCTHHSVLWAVLHAVLGWLYIIYWVACTNYDSTVKIPW